MIGALAERVARDLSAEMPAAVRSLAAQLATRAGAVAALFYGSNLRTGELDGVLDYYLLTPGPAARGMWPTVSYHEADVEGRTLRAKVATMPLATFVKAARGETIDTTIWTRFVQPSALAWVADHASAGAVREAVADAIATAARFAGALGPGDGEPSDYWRALFRATYAAEFRVEAGGREEQIIAFGRDRFNDILPLGWDRLKLGYRTVGSHLQSRMGATTRARTLAQWRRRQALGKPLNVARLVRAAFTFEGAARYAAWKIERHTGVPVALTPWRERHPILAAPGVLWRVWRARQA